MSGYYIVFRRLLIPYTKNHPDTHLGKPGRFQVALCTMYYVQLVHYSILTKP